MVRKIANPSRFLSKKDLLYLLLLDRIIESPLGHFPLTEEAARLFQVNINTVKSVYASLAADGYIQTRRKAGTRTVRTFTREQIDAYRAAKDKIKAALKPLEMAGFSQSELVAMTVGLLDDYSPHDGRIIYTESDFYELMIGQQELELAFGIRVAPRYLKDIVDQLKAGSLQADLIITTFYCEAMLREHCGDIPVVPLKITPPLEQLLNFPLLPRSTNITLIVISDEIRRRVQSVYPNIVKDFPFFHIHTVSELLEDKGLIRNTEILLTLKMLFTENRDIFQRVPKIVTFNRFQDEEGFGYIRDFLAPA